MTKEENIFRGFNRKVRSKDPTCELQIPSNFKGILDHKSPVKVKKTARRKKSILNLDQNYEEYKEDEP